jgi:hypothetical protein
MNRTGEKDAPPTRNSRFYKRDGYFYYATREGIDIGPFDSMQEAQTGASAFIDFVLHAEPHELQCLIRYSNAA